MDASEPFPLLNTSADQLHSASADHGTTARRRRKSSGLGAEIRAGDTSAPALASSRASLAAVDTNGSAQHDAPKRYSKRRRARGALTRMRQTMLRHTFVLPAVILAIFLTLYAINPSESNPIHHFIFLSYPIPQADPAKPVQYGKGLWDVAFVAFYTVVLSFTREFIMQEVIAPLARRAGLNRGKQARFMEQSYTALYFAVLGPAGMYVMSKTPVWYFNTRGMYEDFPHKTHEAGTKFYYLFQAAYWSQQAIVLLLGMEKPRKDFKELVAHHIVSLALIALSYRFHFTYMGLAVYTTHDISDFFLATSKMLNYLDHPLVTPYFLVFMAAWVYLRHFINLKIIVSLFTEYPTVGPYVLDWAAGQYKCELARWITLALLASLQALNMVWLFYIVRIAYRLVVHNIAEDERSDAEDEDEEVEATKPAKHVNGKALNGTKIANGSARR